MAGNFFQAFATGAATTLTENIKREEKNARELAAAQAEMLISNHNKVRDAREKQANKMIDDVDFLSSQFPTISKDDLVLASTNPSAVAALRARAAQPDWNPQSIKFSDFAELTSTNTGYSVGKLVNDLFDKSVAKKTAIEKDLNMSLIQRITAGAQEQELKRIVAPLGYDVDKLRADVGRRPEIPEGKVKFNLGVLATPSYDAEYKKAKLEVVEAQKANDPIALAKASAKVAAFVVTEALTKTETLTNEQIQSNLVTQIQTEKDPAKRTVLETQLNDRQKLLASDRKVTEADIRTDIASRIIEAKKTGDTKQVTLLTGELKQREQLLDKQETNAEKISAANYISAATKGVASAVQDSMPPGSLITITNPDGSTSVTLKDLASEKLYRQGINNGRTAVIAQMTNQDGKPKSELHKVALISIGVVFDSNGVARLPSTTVGTPPPPAPVVTPAPAPAPAKQSAPTPAAPASKTLPATTKTATMADVNAFATQKKLSPAQVKADLEKNGYKIVD
jgi:hypothetical protein